MDRYYKPSGEFSSQVFPLFVLSTFIALPILSFFYAYSSLFLKGALLSFIATVLFIYVVARVMQFVIKGGKVRNQTLAGVMGMIFGFFAFYFYWSSLAILISKSNGLFFLSLLDLHYLIPNKLFTLTKEVNQSAPVINWFYLILKGVFIFLISKQAARKASQRPFSEKDGVWLKEKKILVNFIEDKDKFVSDLEKGEYEVLEHLERRDGQSESHAVIKLYYTDHGEFYMKARNKIARQGQKNEISFSKDRFLKDIISIDPSNGHRLLNLP